MLDRDLVLPHLIAKRALEQPDRVFLRNVEGPTRTYSQLLEGNLKWADAFHRLGVDAEDHVVTMMPNSFEAFDAWLGLAWLRAVEVPINTMYRGRMLQYVVDNSKARVLVIAERFLDRLPEIAGELPEVKTLVVPDAESVDVEFPFQVADGRGFLGDATPADLPGPDYYDISCMIYTSGTTGPSKGVLVPWPEIYHFGLIMPPDGLDENGVYYPAIWPPFHIAGKVALYLPAIKNADLVLRDVFSVSSFWDDVRAFGCTSAGLLGPLASLLLMQPAKPDDADNPLRNMTCGPLIPQIEEFKARFGVKVATGYGMTETGTPFASDGWNVPNWKSCGKPRKGAPGYQVRIVDEHDEEVPTGVVGELVVRSDEPWVLNAGYFGMPEKTAEAWRNGWFHTGDGFMVDREGNYYFVDRLKDAIRRMGENISSFEVEGYVNAHPDVVESAAIAVPSELGEDEVKVVVVRKPDSDLTPKALIEFLIPGMPRFMIPRYVEFVDALPKTEATVRTKKVELRPNAMNENTWDRETAGIEIPK